MEAIPFTYKVGNQFKINVLLSFCFVSKIFTLCRMPAKSHFNISPCALNYNLRKILNHKPSTLVTPIQAF